MNFLSCNPSFGRIAYKHCGYIAIHKVAVLAVLNMFKKALISY